MQIFPSAPIFPAFLSYVAEKSAKRQHFIKIYFLVQKKEKKKFGYHFRKNAQVDTADLQLYEAVERMPPFTREAGPTSSQFFCPKDVKHSSDLIGSYATFRGIKNTPK
jgi:hypothetical protein